ncbi:hypothetical protein DSO57_1031503 [Entomophthora muscae]|uniref:Uncharacterized protein n=1 Tax=Entomophthora muscae TaxID=34485 RepID=A0ACC2TCN1_9FUNG|nr:hypothetical protein DSO57_1031503 [Entomophthora muscae]
MCRCSKVEDPRDPRVFMDADLPILRAGTLIRAELWSAFPEGQPATWLAIVFVAQIPRNFPRTSYSREIPPRPDKVYH